MHLQKLLRFAVLITTFVSIAATQLTAEETKPQATTPTVKASYIPLQITINPSLKFSKEKIQDLRHTWLWDNNYISYKDSIQDAEPYPDSTPVMFVYFKNQIPDNAISINIYTIYTPRGMYNDEQLFALGSKIASLTPETPSFYIEQTMMNDVQPTAIWIEAVLDNDQKIYSKPLFLPSLQAIGLTTLNNYLDTPSTPSTSPGNDIY